MINLKKIILKFLYKLFIFKVIVINRSNLSSYDKLKTFCEYELMSNMGPIKFIFKEDRRKKRRKFDNLLFLNSFFIELKVPDEIIIKRQEINDKAVIVIKLIFFKINYEILAEVLLDIYIDTIFKFLISTPDRS